MNKELNVETFAAMQTNKPIRTYKKTILGKAYCTVLDPFNNSPVGMLLSGDPTKDEESSMVDMWTDVQDTFFRRMNKKALETGTIIEYQRKGDAFELHPEPYATSSDDEIDAVINGKYYSFLSALGKITSQTVASRFLGRARAIDKSEKIINAIEARLSELESGLPQEE